MSKCSECNYSIIDGGSLGCLQYGDSGKFYEIGQIKKALSSGECERFKEINNKVES
jgi:hypothetical protein